MDCPNCSRCATVNYSGEGYQATKNTWWLQSAPPPSLSKSTSGEKLLKRVTIQVLSSLLQHVPFLHYLTLSRAYLAHNWMSSPQSGHSRKLCEQNKSPLSLFKCTHHSSSALCVVKDVIFIFWFSSVVLSVVSVAMDVWWLLGFLTNNNPARPPQGRRSLNKHNLFQKGVKQHRIRM